MTLFYKNYDITGATNARSENVPVEIGFYNGIVRVDANTLYGLMQHTSDKFTYLYKSVDNGVNWSNLGLVTNKTSLDRGVSINYDAANNWIIFGHEHVDDNPTYPTYHRAGFSYYDITGVSFSAKEPVFSFGWGFHAAPHVNKISGGNIYIARQDRDSYGDSEYHFHVWERTGPATWVKAFDSGDYGYKGAGSPAYVKYDSIVVGSDIHYVVYLFDSSSDPVLLHVWYDGSWHYEEVPWNFVPITDPNTPTIGVTTTGDVYVAISDNWGTFDNKLYFNVKSGGWGAMTSQALGIVKARLVTSPTDEIYVVGIGNDTNKFRMARYAGGLFTGYRDFGSATTNRYPSIVKHTLYLDCYSCVTGTEQVDYFRMAWSPDTDQPYVDRNVPDCGDVDVALDSTITFNINDLQTGVKESSVTIEVDFDDGSGYQMIWQNDAVVNPGLGNTVKTLQNDNHSIEYEFTPAAPFSELKNISYRVNADDNETPANSLTDYTCGFTTLSTSPIAEVEIINEFPTGNGIAINTAISFDIIGKDNDIAINTITLEIIDRDIDAQTEVVYQVLQVNQTWLAGWTGSITPRSFGYTVSVTKDGDLTEKHQYMCTAYGEDATANNDTGRWMFYTLFTGGISDDIYVDSLNGDDANAGTELSPFATLEKAISELRPTYAIYMNPGKGYSAPNVENVWYPGHGYLLQGHLSGSVGNPTRIIAIGGVAIGQYTAGLVINPFMFALYNIDNFEIKGNGADTDRFYLDVIPAGFIAYQTENLLIQDIWINNKNGVFFQAYNRETTLGAKSYKDYKNVVINKCYIMSTDAQNIHVFGFLDSTGSETYIYNCTIAAGAELFPFTDKDPAVMANCQIYGDVSNFPTQRVQHKNNNVYPKTNDLDPDGVTTTHIDPLFWDSETWFDTRLQPLSPSRNAGVVIPGYTDGYSGSNPDVGAFENRQDIGVSNNLFVDSDTGDDFDSGTSWGTAFKTVERALYESEAGITINVKENTQYSEPILLPKHLNATVGDKTILTGYQSGGNRPVNVGIFGIRCDYGEIHYFDTIGATIRSYVHSNLGIFTMPVFSILDCDNGRIYDCIAARPVNFTEDIQRIDGVYGFILGRYRRPSNPKIWLEPYPTRGTTNAYIHNCLVYGLSNGIFVGAQGPAFTGNKIYNLTIAKLRQNEGVILGGIEAAHQAAIGLDIKNCSVTRLDDVTDPYVDSFRAYWDGATGVKWVITTNFTSSNHNYFDDQGGPRPTVPTIYEVAGLNGIFLEPDYVNEIMFLLNITSPNIDAGVNVGLPYSGTAPDIGWKERIVTPIGWTDVTQWYAHIM